MDTCSASVLYISSVHYQAQTATLGTLKSNLFRGFILYVHNAWLNWRHITITNFIQAT
jgi:hypothetical protein